MVTNDENINKNINTKSCNEDIYEKALNDWLNTNKCFYVYDMKKNSITCYNHDGNLVILHVRFYE